MRMTKSIKNEMLGLFEETYGDTKTALHYTTPFELMVAVVLSAQCTDERVNIVTKRLFPEFSGPEKILGLGLKGLEERIKDCGLYHSKAKNILAACGILCEKYNGEVPHTFDELVALPGVGRKTANVLISILYDVPAIAVDTHVFRVSNRTKLAVGKTPLEVEKKLQKAIPIEKWSAAHHWLIWHGRKICKARKPLCMECFLKGLCPSYEEAPKDTRKK